MFLVKPHRDVGLMISDFDLANPQKDLGLIISELGF